MTTKKEIQSLWEAINKITTTLEQLAQQDAELRDRIQKDMDYLKDQNRKQWKTINMLLDKTANKQRRWTYDTEGQLF